MKIHILEIPDQPAELALWLEEQLVGLDLAAVVTELYAIGTGEALPEKTLEQVLGSDLPKVLEQGLTVLPAAKLKELVRSPALLLQLQVQVFVEGGAYWHHRTKEVDAGTETEMTRHVEQGRARMRAFLDSQRPRGTAAPNRLVGGGGFGGEDNAGPNRMAWYRHPMLASLATAAVLMLGFFFTKTKLAPSIPVAQAQGWGWSRPGAIDDSLTARDYLTKLSDAAADWEKKKPATPAELSKRILEFRQGCSTLILSEHKPLKPEDKAWLIERCQAWAKKLDQHVADLEAGKDILEVRAQADETVNKLRKALKDRAETV